ncbi:transcriptional regulator, LacI family [Octadecabacter temperatus]|jgi:DNA-binding LacI/PurR family transcriptional regulator|uniref:Ribose operon repressor n=1 Tax=Octadecabacter temperatus TaxID=1458307 RepID=A0A0K0Y8G7_9RHOB|nr:LacI family DNA-binding transcriptional regulator [Octadecabacter temperatus]AKS47167.1 Ribose operon repressor [Octadecabacter temperatus]SIO45765.1 transcriptional regulator, LacI family [Octadecabacter temperatus]
MAVTLKDVAEMAGVSRSAVSRTFTEGASVSAKTRAKVMKAAKELGYSPNALASSLTTGRTKMIGLVSNNFHNPIFLEVFDLFTRGLHERDLRPLLVNLTDETDPEASVRMLRQYSVDGVIVASSTLPHDFARAFRDAGVPVVHSFGRQTATPAVDVLGIDNIAAGKLAALTLIERGYTEVGFLGGPVDATSTIDRQTGFLAEVAKHPKVTATTSFANAYSFEAGRAEMARLLASKPAQAYFCGDDVLSIGAMSALQSAGLNVPDDIGIIGLNDMEMAGWENINLTTIHNPVTEIIAASIARVVQLVADPTLQPQARLFNGSVIERGTLQLA